MKLGRRLAWPLRWKTSPNRCSKFIDCNGVAISMQMRATELNIGDFLCGNHSDFRTKEGREKNAGKKLEHEMRGRAMEMYMDTKKEMLMNQTVAALARRFDMISSPDTDTDTNILQHNALCTSYVSQPVCIIYTLHRYIYFSVSAFWRNAAPIYVENRSDYSLRPCLSAPSPAYLRLRKMREIHLFPVLSICLSVLEAKKIYERTQWYHVAGEVLLCCWWLHDFLWLTLTGCAQSRVGYEWNQLNWNDWTRARLISRHLRVCPACPFRVGDHRQIENCPFNEVGGNNFLFT